MATSKVAYHPISKLTRKTIKQHKEKFKVQHFEDRELIDKFKDIKSELFSILGYNNTINKLLFQYKSSINKNLSNGANINVMSLLDILSKNKKLFIKGQSSLSKL